ncbi:hypothetical protein [Sediminimonas sp.]|uniref:hypothetical protein n=1 Tax=Sediminimonas sp. TaxID=2823379 RepID=UPI0025CC8D07|nr:hypothetical protein [Sediminimonas sp.]
MPSRDVVGTSPRVGPDSIASTARALALPARVRIIEFLLSRPGCIGGDIVGEVGLAQSTVIRVHAALAPFERHRPPQAPFRPADPPRTRLTLKETAPHVRI